MGWGIGAVELTPESASIEAHPPSNPDRKIGMQLFDLHLGQQLNSLPRRP